MSEMLGACYGRPAVQHELRGRGKARANGATLAPRQGLRHTHCGWC